MKNFLEKTLRQNVMIEETEYLNEKLPWPFVEDTLFIRLKQTVHHG